MKEQQFKDLCSSLSAAGPLFVENLDFCYSGKVLACRANALEVEAFGHQFTWEREKCRPASGANPLGPASSR